ncbi:hypothetical protein Hte_001897 [Hypoxylon texense]
MTELRKELTAFYNNEAERDHDDKYAAMNTLRRIAQLLEEEGLYGLELSLVYMEQARICDSLGEDEGRRDKMRQALKEKLRDDYELRGLKDNGFFQG